MLGELEYLNPSRREMAEFSRAMNSTSPATSAPARPASARLLPKLSATPGCAHRCGPDPDTRARVLCDLSGEGEHHGDGQPHTLRLERLQVNTSRGELLKTDETPIDAMVARVRERIYGEDFETCKFDSNGALKPRSRKLAETDVQPALRIRAALP